MVQRTYTTATDRIAGHIQPGSKCDRFEAVDNVHQGTSVSQTSDRRMKEAGANYTIRFDHRGRPRSVASWCCEIRKTQMSPEMIHDPLELCAAFQNEAT